MQIVEAALLPPDLTTHLFPGADHEAVPVDSLLSIPGRYGRRPLPDNMIGPGSFITCKAEPGTSFLSHPLPFTMGMMVEGGVHLDADSFIVQWWVPSTSPRANMRPGPKTQVVDIFGAWQALATLTVDRAAEVNLPPVLVNRVNVLVINVQLDQDDRIPFSAFDQLRLKHGIDVTGLSTSMTHFGNIYRAYVLMNVGKHFADGPAVG